MHNICLQARPRYKDKNSIWMLADPLLKGAFPESTFKKVLEVAFMCVNENPTLRPTTRDVVRALEYLSSQHHDPNEPKKARTKGPEVTDSPSDTLALLDKDKDRERAVAEAKLWGETLREQRLQNMQNSTDK